MDVNSHYVKFARGTQEEWDALQSNPQKINNDTLYFIYNNNDLTKGKLYLGQRLIVKNNELKEISINDIGDVFIDDETLAHKQILIYNDISKNWENTSLSNIIHNISELNNDIGYITEQEVNNLISGINNLRFEIVEEKPLENIETNVIYLIPKSNPDEHNIYEEWIYSNDNWELIGSINNLDDYMKKIKYIDNYGPATFDLKTDGQFYQKGDIIYNKDNDFFYLKNISEFTYNYDKIYYHYEWQRLGNKIFVSDYDASPIKYYANYTSHRLNFPQTYFKGDIVICPDGKYLCTKMTFDYNFAFNAKSGTLEAMYNGRWQKIDDSASQIIKKDIFPPYYFIDSTTEESYNLKEGDIWIYDCNNKISRNDINRYINENNITENSYTVILNKDYPKQLIFTLSKISYDENLNRKYYFWKRPNDFIISGDGIGMLTNSSSFNFFIGFSSFYETIKYIPTSVFQQGDIIFSNTIPNMGISICYSSTLLIDENKGRQVSWWFPLSDYYTKTEIDTLINDKENISNKTISLSSSSTNEQYPSAKAVYDALLTKANDENIPVNISQLNNDSGFLTSHQDISGKEDKSNKVTSISEQSTDEQYPSAKAIYDNFYNKNEIGSLYNQIFFENSRPPSYGNYSYQLKDLWIDKSSKTVFILSNINNKDYTWTQLNIKVTYSEEDPPRNERQMFIQDPLRYNPGDIWIKRHLYFSGSVRPMYYLQDMYICIGSYKQSTPPYDQYNITWEKISGKEDKINKTTFLSSESTDTQYPSAKAVYEKIKLLLLNENYDNSLNKIVISSNTITYKALYEYALDHMGFITIDSSETIYKHYYFTSAIFDNDTYEINFYNISNGQQYVFHGIGTENDFVSITQYDEHNFT